MPELHGFLAAIVTHPVFLVAAFLTAVLLVAAYAGGRP